VVFWHDYYNHQKAIKQTWVCGRVAERQLKQMEEVTFTLSRPGSGRFNPLEVTLHGDLFRDWVPVEGGQPWISLDDPSDAHRSIIQGWSSGGSPGTISVAKLVFKDIKATVGAASHVMVNKSTLRLRFPNGGVTRKQFESAVRQAVLPRVASGPTSEVVFTEVPTGNGAEFANSNWLTQEQSVTGGDKLLWRGLSAVMGFLACPFLAWLFALLFDTPF